MSDTVVAGHGSPSASPLPLPREKGGYPVAEGILFADLLPPVPAYELTAATRNYLEPYVGVTEDGTVRRGLYPLTDTGDRPNAIVAAARAYLGSLAPSQKAVAQQPMDSPDWRLWANALPTWFPKGMRLERLAEAQRALALAVIESSLSREGNDLVRAAMKLNEALGELIDDYHDLLTEFNYWFTVYGDPASGQPWGWQLMGHHIDLHCVFVGSQMVFAPVFIGAEPIFSVAGRHAGVRVFDEETEVGLTFRRALTHAQEDRFLLNKSIMAADLPPELAGPWNGRHVSAAGNDNLVLPAEGITGAELTAAQQSLLLELVGVYVRRMPGEHAERKLEQVARHLGETRFAWRGGHDDIAPFYYRIHSPVLLVEYDNHPGVFLSNPEPERFHVHTIVREPNGNDYGKDLLAQHYALHHAPANGAASSAGG